MRETIGLWADYIATCASLVMLLAYTIEAAAKGWSITAALFSPITVLAWAVAIFWLAKTLGYIETPPT